MWRPASTSPALGAEAADVERSTIASRGRHDLTALAEALAGTFPAARDSALTVALVRELARGQPVADPALAAMTGRV